MLGREPGAGGREACPERCHGVASHLKAGFVALKAGKWPQAQVLKTLNPKP